MPIILDLETVAIAGVEASTEPVTAPAHYRDPEKIAAYIAEKQADQVTRAALYPWTARVVCLGYIDPDGRTCAPICRTEADEAAALQQFWRAVYRADERFVHPIVGFNHRTFDLPVLLARSVLLGVPAPGINLDRYRTPHTDLLDRLTWFGAIPARSLKWYARRLGIPVEDTTGGADIAGLVAAGEWEAVQAHCLSDLRLTQAVGERLGILKGAQLSVGAL